VLVWAAAFGTTVVAIAWAATPAPGNTRAVRGGDPPVSAARAVFLRDCATCHGADALGTDLAPSLHGAGAALVDYYVSTGRMPLANSDATVERHEPRYPPAMIRALVAYVSALTGGGGPPIPRVDPGRGDLPQGGEIYRLNCAACHSWSGDGGALLEREAPPLHAATPTQIGEAVRAGPGNMPAFGTSAITRRQLDGVIAYVGELDHPHDRGGAPLGHLGPMAEGAIAIVLGLGALVIAVRWIGTRT